MAPSHPDAMLCNDLLGDIAGNISQSEVAPSVKIGELLVIESHQMQNSRMQVVDVHPVLGRIVAKLVLPSSSVVKPPEAFARQLR